MRLNDISRRAATNLLYAACASCRDGSKLGCALIPGLGRAEYAFLISSERSQAHTFFRDISPVSSKALRGDLCDAPSTRNHESD